MGQSLAKYEIERRDAQLADIELGLQSTDRLYWRAVARRRIRALQADQMDYGLMPYEVEELELLEQMVGREIRVFDILVGSLAFAAAVAFLIACSFWSPA